MKTVSCKEITRVVRDLCIEANRQLPVDIEICLHHAAKQEKNPLGADILKDLENNLTAAKELGVPICQDTGMAVVFIDIGQEVYLSDGLLEDAVNQGVRQGYVEGLLRLSVVADPLRRVNTGDNTPAIIHTRMIAGDKVKIMVAPKGFGSENMSVLKMFTPSATPEDIIQFVADVVKGAGSNPCPPVVVGVGIGGDFELAALLAKRALCRSADIRNADPFYAQLEEQILERVNSLDIGPQGFGGNFTALCVNIEKFATHIAGLPVAVNIGCHVTRHASAEL